MPYPCLLYKAAAALQCNPGLRRLIPNIFRDFNAVPWYLKPGLLYLNPGQSSVPT